ncbi:MAG TPA: LuxR C-terminal-related transcriptional regulator [Thermoleophilia bacterium]|nr:LuxR C-terminal-related transcriptional regulator [Thermoleophilia bacterium]
MPKRSARKVAIEAKYLRPRVDHVSLRADALAALGAAFGRRLIVICAPAGYGKTTMTAAALDHFGRTAAWYKLDTLDHDPFAFLASVIRAVHRLHHEFGAALLRELEATPVVEVAIEVLAARFCSESDRLLTTDLYLVLDDYHEAMDSAAMNDVLGYLLENCPPTLHFVVLTRYEPAFRLEKLNLAGQVSRLQRDLFLFDAAQVAEVLTQRSGRSQEPDDVRRLLELTEGWAASVVLAGMALAWLDVASLEEALGDPRLRGDVFSYLAEQVFQRQTEEVQRFLLGTCCLEHVTAALAEAITGSAGGSRHLSFLARNHVFTFDTDRRGAYRYHNLLRDFLRQRFVQEESEDAFRELQRRTAVALEASGDRAGAVELLLAANDAQLALGVLARGGEAELERRPSEQLRLWAARLSSEAEAGDPWALITSAVIATRDGRFAPALKYLESACAALEQAGDARGLYQALSITEWAEFWSGDSAASIGTCHHALDLAASDSERLHTLLSLLSAAVDMKRWDTVAEAADRAGAYLDRASPEEAARAQGLKAHAAYFQGDMFAARRLITASRNHGERVAQRAAALNIRGMIETALGDYASAKIHLADAAAAADGFGDSSTSYIIEDSRACLASAMGHSDEAISALKTLGTGSGRACEPLMRAYTLCHLGTVLRRSGSLVACTGPTEEAIASTPLDREPYLALNAAANLHVAQGLQGEDRVKSLLETSRHAAARSLRFVELKALLFSAVLLHVQGDTRLAVETLETCLPRQLQLGHVNLIAQELGPRPELTSQVLRRHRTNGLGPQLMSALSRYPRFTDVSTTLRKLGPSQINTWMTQVPLQEAGSGLREVRSRPPSSCCQQKRLGDLGTLTRREIQVLELMAEDYGNDEIASTLFISIPTVKTHVTHILRKLEQKTRIGAVLEYQRLSGQLNDPPGEYDGNLHPHC